MTRLPSLPICIQEGESRLRFSNGVGMEAVSAFTLAAIKIPLERFGKSFYIWGSCEKIGKIWQNWKNVGFWGKFE